MNIHLPAWREGYIILPVRVTPNARKTEVLGWEENTLKIKLAAPPVDGKANKALCEFMADWLGVAKRDISLVSGDTSRIKRLKIDVTEKNYAAMQRVLTVIPAL